MLIQEKINAPDTLLKMSNSVTASVRRVSGRGKHRDHSYGNLLLVLSGTRGLFILRVERSFGALQDYQDFLFRVLWQVWTVEQLQRGRMNLFKGVKQGNDFFFTHKE